MSDPSSKGSEDIVIESISEQINLVNMVEEDKADLKSKRESSEDLDQLGFALTISPRTSLNVQIKEMGPIDWLVVIDNTEYKLRRPGISNAQEAEKVYYEIFNTRSGGKKDMWSDKELDLLQWLVMNYSFQRKIPVNSFVFLGWT
eukprot:TRINITY_DN3625_c0_g2_i1.p2 TRINITY_DN3625_c0_g2~~TRINITY_DN3625_c0_g2_i1.p2  ORF type:complete len:145 (-),score=35.20 TRINITY_DN3625_c0_g2_i1:980-1414(-)